MDFDVVIDARVNKETAIWNDGARKAPLLGIEKVITQKYVFRSRFLWLNKP